MADEIPDDVRHLLADQIQTYEHLEVLMLLARRPDDLLEVGVVAETLGMAASAAAKALDELANAGLLTRSTAAHDPRFRYQPERAELDATVTRLHVAYADCRLAIMNEMTANALQRVRTAGMRAFARAFLFERKGGRADA